MNTYKACWLKLSTQNHLQMYTLSYSTFFSFKSSEIKVKAAPFTLL